MSKARDPLLIRWFLLVSIVVLVATVTADLVSLPAVVMTAGKQGPIYLALFIGGIGIYLWVALFRTSVKTAQDLAALQWGSGMGVLCGVFWIIELSAANLMSHPPRGLTLPLYFTSALVAYLLPGLAGYFAGRRTGRFDVGLQSGLLCGMLGGLMIFLATLILMPLLQSAGQVDPQTLREFQRSALPDLKTYIVGDYIAGMVAHLWIGLLTGLILGAAGSAIGKAFHPS